MSGRQDIRLYRQAEPSALAGNRPRASVHAVDTLPHAINAEWHQVVRAWNETATDYQRTRCIHHLFEEQARRTPDAIALVFEQEWVTYQELNRRADLLACQLQASGVGPEILVGFYLERSALLPIVLLGILKAGGAYVPLDPAYPHERLTLMIQDAQVAILLTQHDLYTQATQLQEHLPTLVVDTHALQGTPHTLDEPLSEVGPTNLAYVLYTSGSTGKPKGVLIQHQGLCNLVMAQNLAFQVNPGDHVLQLSSICFDASIFEMVMALCTGASLHLCSRHALAPEPLASLLTEQGITIGTFTPTMLAALAEEHFPRLQTVISAGEACPTKIAQRWSNGRRFFNAYGPTETTVCATVAEYIEQQSKPAIGKPIANMQVYLLDSHMQPAAIDTPGEIYIGGEGLARGYLNRPDLTAERFTPNPFSARQGSRLYKTGDQARYLPDGSIEFVGRLDTQVKLRGFRIELGEVEAILNQLPTVRECVVALHQRRSGEQLLVAYMVAAAGEQPPLLHALRIYAKQYLPDYMLPSALVVLDALPLLPNGKIDRRALPAPDHSRYGNESKPAPSCTPEEQALIHIWSEVLGQTTLGIDDDFFELEGHSLTAAQIVSRIRKTFAVDLQVHDIFDAPTIRELALRIIQHQEH